MVVFPSASHVLQRAEGYRDLLSHWRLFHTSVDPFAEMQRALDVRDVAKLYEWWCFFALVEEIGEVLTLTGPLSHEVDSLEGLRRRLTARFEGGWELIFNRSFSAGAGPWRSYSVQLRPDFVLAHQGVPLVGLDAKFRFDRNDFERAADEDEEHSDLTETLREDSNLRMAKNADIYKMHTYRDALDLQCVLVVYPGDDTVLYESDGGRRTNILLADLIADPPPAGVGAITLSPEE